MDLIFFGSGAFGVPTLRRLAAEHRVLAVVTQPDRAAGRGGGLTPTPVAAFAAAEMPGVRVLKAERVNEPGLVGDLRGLGADAWVVIAFGQKFGRALLEERFAINLHASLLPRWRGAAPIHAAVLAGDTETGNSVITLAERMDAGLVLGQTRRPIDAMQTAGELHDALAEDGPALVEAVLDRHARGVLQGIVQDEGAVTIAPKLSRADGWVDFSQSAEDCRRRVHGLTPWPGVTVGFRGEPLKVLRVGPRVVTESGAGVPGEVLDAERGVVCCGAGELVVLEVQPAGKRAMTWGDFVRGARVRSGEHLIGRARKP